MGHHYRVDEEQAAGLPPLLQLTAPPPQTEGSPVESELVNNADEGEDETEAGDRDGEGVT